MVSIDTVYQKVLALANKEQRGYITPQEFNLMADKAQLEIINSYFHDMKTAYIKPKNQTEAFDEIEMLKEKLSFIRTTDTSLTIDVASGQATTTLPTDVYMIATLYLVKNGPSQELNPYPEIVEVSRERLLQMLSHPLTKPTVSRPVYVRKSPVSSDSDQSITLDVFPAFDSTTVKGISDNSSATVDYFKKPSKPNWGYVVIGDKALYNANNSTNFSLHPSDEETLVTRILELSGISMQRPDVLNAALVDKQNTIQQQNN
tara:strand:+ start:230 stop:1009 length:780 start_codon:yes stop_codon:yes gene_type:complete